jgi:SAM-dependent methyltransferase
VRDFTIPGALRCTANRKANFNQDCRDVWVADRAKAIPAGSLVLDVGAGTGRYRKLFAHCDYKSQDLSAYRGTDSGLQKDSWLYGPLDYVCDAASIAVPDGTFDAVVCTEVLEHVPEPILVIREISRILRPGGRLILTAPLGSGLHQQPYHFYGGFTPHFYRKFLPESGLSIVNIQLNGGFFRHLLQELFRAGHILRAFHGGIIRTSLFKVLSYLLCVIVPIWLSALDEEIFVEEFTVGYHVEATKDYRTAHCKGS